MIVTQSTTFDPRQVAINEWPNPPWNTIAYEWDASYKTCSPEWFAQQTAHNAYRLGLRYIIGDLAEEQRQKLAQYLAEHSQPEQALELASARPSHRKQEYKAMPKQDEKPIRFDIGVIDDTHLYLVVNGKLVKREVTITRFIDVLQLGIDARVHAVWILPGCTVSRQATKEWITDMQETGWRVKNPQFEMCEDSIERCTCTRGYKAKAARQEGESGRDLTVMFPEHNSDWQLDAIYDPVTLLGAVAYQEDALGVDISYKPNSYGRRLMIAYNQDNTSKGWIQPVNIRKALPLPIAWGDCNWIRKLTPEEVAQLISQGYIAVDSYDKNSEYTASCTSVRFGTGAPVHEIAPVFNVERPLPGVYYCKIDEDFPTGFDGVQLPHPTDGQTEGWFWTYTVQLLYELGYIVEITEAYVWHESHVMLRKWGETLWRARCQLNSKNELCNVKRYKHQAARDAAYEGVKDVMNTSLGMLAHPKDLDELEKLASNEDAPENDRKYARQTLAWYRPDWYALLIDRSRAMMFREMKKRLSEDVILLGEMSDCLFYAARTHDHALAIPGMLARADKLGGFKPGHSGVTVTLEETAEYFTEKKADIRKLNGYMNNKEKEMIEERHKHA
jgi:hypothetical protein